MPKPVVEPQAEKPQAVVLLSGGLDSATVLAIAKNDGFEITCLSFNYGQRHAAELDAAKRVAEQLGAADHIVYPLDLRIFGGSALTDTIDVPKDRDHATIASGIPVTYVPARNLIFLSIAAALAETENARDLYVGVTAMDYSGYPDCRPEFIEAFEETVNLATQMGVESIGEDRVHVHTPLIDLSKPDIVALGTKLGVDYALTHSCYDPSPDGLACGRCDSCALRRKGFEGAGVPDPTRYADQLGDAS
ncbi:MAG: 7-cyano-7-deazaguanine synthase QueC [Planctomycetota bacterium]